MESNRLTVTLTRELLTEIQRIAESEKRSKSNTVQLLLIEAIETRKRK